jgi:hypothetical protein
VLFVLPDSTVCMDGTSRGPGYATPSQYGGLVGVAGMRTGAAAAWTAVQKLAAGSAGRTIPVTSTTIFAPPDVSVSRDPGCSPNRAAVAWVTATWNVAPVTGCPGSCANRSCAAPGYRPASRRE